MELTEAIRSRRSVKHYTKGVPITEEELRELFADATLAPSSFNIQHWSFVVVRDQSNKDDLMEAAFGQPQVGACSAAIIVVANPEQYTQAISYWEQSGVPESVLENYRQMIPGIYKDNPQKARDEALRSVGLVAGTLMLKAKDMGWETGPMIGFDPDKVAKRFDIDHPKFPAMLIVLGKASKLPHDRPYRRELAEVVKLEDGKGAGLGG